MHLKIIVLVMFLVITGLSQGRAHHHHHHHHVHKHRRSLDNTHDLKEKVQDSQEKHKLGEECEFGDLKSTGCECLCGSFEGKPKRCQISSTAQEDCPERYKKWLSKAKHVKSTHYLDVFDDARRTKPEVE